MDKDEALDRLLRRTSRARSETRASGTCLDAETLAAWADGALTPAEREMAEAHTADCDRCLSMLASLAQTSPPPVTTESSRWFSVRWLIPVATAMVAVTVWVMVQRLPVTPMPVQTPEPSPPAPSAPATPVDAVDAREKAAAEQPAGSQAAVSKPAPESRADLAQPQRTASGRRAARVAESAAADQTAVGKSQASEAAVSAAKESQQALADSSRSATKPEEVAAEAKPTPTAAPAQSPAATAPGTVAGSDAQRQRFSGIPSPPPAAPAARPEPPPSQTIPRAGADPDRMVSMRREAPAIIDVQSPDGNVRWRIVGATVSRTSTGGRIWTEQFTGTATTLRAGSSPAPAICWLVGAAGVVLLSTDGETWRRLPFPEPSADLVQVTAVDGTTATVTAADGRVFRTTDSGRTWTPQEKRVAPF